MLLFPADIEGSKDLWGVFPNPETYLIASLLLTSRSLVALLMLFLVIQVAMNGPNRERLVSTFRRSDRTPGRRKEINLSGGKYMNNLFKTVKSAVSVPKAAAFYGLNADHSGMIRCLFHPDHNPSMKLYDDHFYCFGCCKCGDVITLTAQLLHLSPLKAAEKLAADFRIVPPPEGSDGKREPVVSNDIKTIQENMGHYSAAFTLDRYGHVTETMRQESANRMQAFIQGMSGNRGGNS